MSQCVVVQNLETEPVGNGLFTERSVLHANFLRRGIQKGEGFKWKLIKTWLEVLNDEPDGKLLHSHMYTEAGR